MSKESAMALATGIAPVNPAVAAGAPNEPSTPAQAPTQAADPRLQSLLKKETEIVRQREVFNRQKQEWEEKSKRADEILGRGKQFEDMLKTDPVAALKLIGYSETQIFNVMAQANEAPKEKTAEEIARETTEKMLKERDENDQKTRSEQTAQANERAVVNGIKSLITKPENLEKFELCSLSGSHAEDQIKQTLYQFVAEDQKDAQSRGIKYEITEEQAGKLLEEAAEAVEGLYRENIKEVSSTKAFTAMMKEMGWSKAEIQAALAEAEAPVTTTVITPPPNSQAPLRPKTITNRVAATTQAMTTNRPETERQKRDRLETILKTGDTTLFRF